MTKAKEKKPGLLSRLRLDPHHQIERFGITFFALIGTLAIMMVLLGVSAFKNNAEILGSKAIYTETFKTSKTESNGDTQGVYINATGDRAMVLMHIADAANFSQNPNNYQAFVTSSKIDGSNKDLKNEFTGSIGVFGSTGYIGVFLDSDEHIASDILSVTVRSTTQLIPSRGEAVAEASDDKTFAQYDQWRVFVNPGASEAKVLPALNSETIDLGNIYYETVLSSEEQEMRDQLNIQLDKMQIALNAIDEYESQLLVLSALDGVKVVPEPEPLPIRGDSVSGKLPVIVSTETENEDEDGVDDGVNPVVEVTPEEFAMSNDFAMSGDASMSVGDDDDEEDVLRLHSDVTLPGGLDFDWQDGSIRTGYINKLLKNDETFVDFLAAKAEEANNSDMESVTSSSVNWKLSNGKFLSDYTKDGPMGELYDQTNLITQAWVNYYQMKSEYQKKMLNDLLKLEYNYQSVVQNGAMSNSEDSVIFY